MIKREELTDPNSCMSRALDNEMTFVLLARDVAAPATIRFWIAERIRLGKNKAGDPQMEEASCCASAMFNVQPFIAVPAEGGGAAPAKEMLKGSAWSYSRMPKRGITVPCNGEQDCPMFGEPTDPPLHYHETAKPVVAPEHTPESCCKKCNRQMTLITVGMVYRCLSCNPLPPQTPAQTLAYFRDQALAAFRKRWKKDAESDGEDLPVEKQLENAWKLGWETLGKVLRDALKQMACSLCAECEDSNAFKMEDTGQWVHPVPAYDGSPFSNCPAAALQPIIAKCDDLMKEK